VAGPANLQTILIRTRLFLILKQNLLKRVNVPSVPAFLTESMTVAFTLGDGLIGSVSYDKSYGEPTKHKTLI
jgi:hypothetical protein